MPRTPDSRFGRIIRYNVERMLTARGLSPSAFLDGAGFCRRRFSAAMKAPHGPTLYTLEQLADLLQVPMWTLLLQPAEVKEDPDADAYAARHISNQG